MQTRTILKEIQLKLLSCFVFLRKTVIKGSLSSYFENPVMLVPSLEAEISNSIGFSLQIECTTKTSVSLFGQSTEMHRYYGI